MPSPRKSRTFTIITDGNSIEHFNQRLTSPALGASHSRVYELDLLRFIAAFCVLLFHYSYRGAAGLPGNRFTTFSYPPLIAVSRYGYLGVNLFFLISGFVILMTANGSVPRRFSISRFVRLYPAYWVCCSISFLTAWLAADPRMLTSFRTYLENMTMLNGVGRSPVFVDGAYWSLAVELKFYFLIFLLLAFRQVSRIQIVLTAWLVAAAILDLHPEKYLNYFLMPEFAAYFIVGATFYLAYLEGWNFYKFALLFGGSAMMLRCALREAGWHLIDYGQPLNHWVIIGCISGFLAIFFLIVAGKLRPFLSRRLLFIGALTYPLYLLHQNCGYIIFNLLEGRINPHALFWGVIGAMILAAALVHILVERRYSRRLKQFLELNLPRFGS